MSPGAHALLSPSSAKRFLSCPPSARLEEKLRGVFGESSSPYAEEGTKAHALAEIKLRHGNGEFNDFKAKAMRDKLGEMWGTIPKDMERSTDEYADIVLGKLFAVRQTCPDAMLLVEQRLDISRWVPQCFGTGDAVIVSDTLLEVCDYKHGTGVKVDARENPQARLYGLGAFAAWGELYGFTHVRNTIIQPRVKEDPITEETLTVEELLAWGESIRPTAEMAWRGEGEFNPGDHCRFCAARALCAARAAKALRPFAHGLAAPGLIPDEEIPGILAVADVAEDWLKDIRAYAKNQALKGQSWPGWKLVRGRKGNRAWTNEEAVREQLIRAGMTEDQYMNNSLKNPGEIEKVLGKQAYDALVKQYVTQADGALNLVPEEDKRAEFSSADADFSDMA